MIKNKKMEFNTDLMENFNVTEADICNYNKTTSGNISLDTNACDELSDFNLINDLMVTNTNKPAVFVMGTLFFAYFTPVIFAVGIVGNSLSLAVFTSKRLRHLSGSKYLAALSVADISSLTFYVLVEWLRRGLEHIDPHLRLSFLDYNGLCQILLYMAYLSRLMSAWIIVVFTIERFTGVCYPLKSFKREAKKILLTLLAVCCVSVLYKPLLSGEYTKRQRIVCTSNPDYELLSFILDGLFAGILIFVPFVIITVLNILIVRKLFLRNKETRDMFSDDSKIRLEFTVILLAISFFFVAFNFPFSVVWTRNFLYFLNFNKNKSFIYVHYLNGVLNITRTIFYMNYCINFFLYNITGKYFRTALINIIACRNSRLNVNGSYIRCRRFGTSSTYVTVLSKKERSSTKSQKESNV